MRQLTILIGAFLTLSLVAQEVLNPGAGRHLARGRVTGTTDVEVCSGIVSATLATDYAGTLRVSGGTLEMTDFGSTNALLVKAHMGTGGLREPFTIQKNEEFDWLEVEPAAGLLTTDLTFQVNLKTEIMTNRHDYRGAFLVRLTNGLSRVVSVQTETDFVPPFRAEKPGETALYADLAHPVAGSLAQGDATFAFDVATSNVYYFLVHGASVSQPRVLVSVDGEPEGESRQQTRAHPTWTHLVPGYAFGNALKPYSLLPGRHTIRIRTSFPYDGLVLTDSPASFEPR